MNTRMVIPAAIAAAVLGAGLLISLPTLASGTGGFGMHGQGNHMMGQGMMGNQMMGTAMMGSGHGANSGCPQGHAALVKELTVKDVTELLEHRLSMPGNDRLKIGKVEQKDDTTIVAEIVTVDDSLVQRIEFDRKTGRQTPAE